MHAMNPEQQGIIKHLNENKHVTQLASKYNVTKHNIRTHWQCNYTLLIANKLFMFQANQSELSLLT